MKNKKENYTFENFKKDFIHLIDRRQHSLDSNLRLVSFGLAIFLFIGIFQPLIGIDAGIALQSKNTGIEKISNKEFSIYDANIEITNLNIGEMAMQKPLKDYQLFGTKLGDIEVFGMNLYDLAKTTFPDGSKIENLAAQLNGEWINFLSTPQFENIVRQYLGDYADNILQLANLIIDFSQNASEVLSNLSLVMAELHDASLLLNNAVISAENIVSIINGFALFLLLLIVASIILLLINKGPKYLPAILISIVTLLYLIIGIGVAIVNGFIGELLSSSMQNLNDGIRTFLETSFGGIYTAISAVIAFDQINFVAKFEIILMAGYWIVMISLLGITFIAYFLPVRNKKLKNKKSNKNKEIEHSKVISNKELKDAAKPDKKDNDCKVKEVKNKKEINTTSDKNLPEKKLNSKNKSEKNNS